MANTTAHKEITTDAQIKSLKPRDVAYYVSLGHERYPGLAIRVAPDGKKTWSNRYRIGRRQRRWTIGPYPKVTLAKVHEMIDALDHGADPQARKQEAREAITVAAFADVYIEKYAKAKKRSWKADLRLLNRDILPAWKHRPLREISRADVRDLLERIADRPARILSNRVRSLLSKMFNVAIKREFVEANPVTHVDKVGDEQQRDRYLSEDEIRTFWAATNTLPLEMQAVWQIRLLTAQRGGEVTGMLWSELDIDGGWWTIPGSRTKNKKTHRVPLSQPVLDLLGKLNERREAHAAKHPDSPRLDAVFRRAKGKRQQADAAELFGLENFVPHDLRRTAATHMTRSCGVTRSILAKVLNHSDSDADAPKVTAIYDRNDYDPDKRAALDRWARHLTAIIEERDSNVVAFAARG